MAPRRTPQGGVRQSLAPRLQQRTTLAPAMQTALTLLRLPAAELHAELMREAADNPYIRLRGPAAGTGVAADSVVARPSALDRLRAQIGEMPLAPPVRAAAEHLAAELREDGYLDTPLAEIAAALGVPEALLAEGLSALQACDPPGVGARGLPECLALQLVDRGLARATASAVVADLEGFVARDWRRLEAALALPRPELERIAAWLPTLVAHPLVPDAAQEAPALVPDLVAEVGGDGAVSVRLADAGRPMLRLDPRLMAETPATPEAAAARARAQALLAGLRARGATLQRIGTWLVAAQPEYLAHGAEHLRPLTRRAVAAGLDLHPSTVGRAVAGKSLALDGRLIPLSTFLSAPLPQSDGPALAGFAVRRRIARMIAAEPPHAPLSDEALRRALAAEGIDIARRTVAKYRDWMRVPSSFRRRRSARPRATPSGRG
ncbi:hypothetical protein [Rhodobaculum claviforme]|nr:hypothetical protein [Rhodobaculum claviforme]